MAGQEGSFERTLAREIGVEGIPGRKHAATKGKENGNSEKVLDRRQFYKIRGVAAHGKRKDKTHARLRRTMLTQHFIRSAIASQTRDGFAPLALPESLS